MGERCPADVQRVIERAVQQAFDNALSARETAALVAAAIAERGASIRPAEVARRESDELLRAFDDRGGGRDAAMRVAREFARDRNDPAELEKIAQHVRALVRRRKTKPLRFEGENGAMFPPPTARNAR